MTTIILPVLNIFFLTEPSSLSHNADLPVLVIRLEHRIYYCLSLIKNHCGAVKKILTEKIPEVTKPDNVFPVLKTVRNMKIWRETLE